MRTILSINFAQRDQCFFEKRSQCKWRCRDKVVNFQTQTSSDTETHKNLRSMSITNLSKDMGKINHFHISYV